ncbi:MAG: hypothetical protein KKE62_05380 [Proteobacteria bacterium]|nr:hypothetical protein [Pseudomonadota bacterium]MBU1388877.1 hypothetical protein [Pseudomonadota bacterium]MBU1542258.1 hypothetical protein [Pseudomonadota bacterium]MBU2431501.1 hypothetical protein [Pseudomonadota bacterium]MBU2480452.1 hypothetical protein [Pseudomonadota bacterium]
MKILLKTLLLLIALSLVGAVVYQNLEYFMTRNTLTIHIEKLNWTWTTPALENIFYIGICFLAGLFLSSVKGLLVKLDLNRIIKTKEDEIKALEEKNNVLKTELEVFQHDPYIKKGLEKKESALQETAIDQQ